MINCKSRRKRRITRIFMWTVGDKVRENAEEKRDFRGNDDVSLR